MQNALATTGDIVADYGTLFLGTRLKRLADRMQADAVHVLERAGWPVQPAHVPLLAALDKHGALTVSQCVDALGISQPGVTRSVGALVDLGFVEVSRPEEDGRQKVLALTQSGAALVARLRAEFWPQVRRVADDLCAGLDGAFLEQVAGLERKLAQRSLAARILDEVGAAVPVPVAGPIVRPARSAQDLAAAAALFRTYAEWTGLDLSLQSFAQELAGLPGAYAPPDGELFLAFDPAGAAVGCLGLRPFRLGESCELKRLYIEPSARGLGLGRRLLDAAVEMAEARGYTTMLLDSLAAWEPAHALYNKLGFERIAPYWSNPFPGVIYFSKSLRNDDHCNAAPSQAR